MAEIHLKKVGTGATKAGKVKSAKEKHPEEYFVNWQQVSNMTEASLHAGLSDQGPKITAIQHRHDFVMEITAWDQEHFQKTQSVNTAQCAHIT